MSTHKHQQGEPVGGNVAGFAVYHQRADRYIFVHTEIHPEFEGHGLASKLARAALDDVTARTAPSSRDVRSLRAGSNVILSTSRSSTPISTSSCRRRTHERVANVDPKVFVGPSRFDIARPTSDESVSFGYGGRHRSLPIQYRLRG